MWKIKEIALFLEKSAEKFCRFKKTSTFALAIEKKNISFADIGIWCNGNTTDSGPVIPGSSPGIPTHTVRHLSVMKGVFFVYRNSVLWSIHNNKPQSFCPGVYCIYFFSASIALIFCFTIRGQP